MRKITKKVFMRSTPIAAGLILAACGGGGGGSSGSGDEATVRLEPGAYLTTIEYEDGGTAEAITFLSSSGRYVNALGDDDVTLGNLTFSGSNSISGTGVNVFFLDGWQSVNGQLSGTVNSTERATIEATAPDFVSIATLERENQYSNSGAQFSQINGTFTMVSGTDTIEITVALDGTITGSDNSGCVFNGEATIPDAQYNILEVDFIASNCGEILGQATSTQRNGAYSGLGAYDQSLTELQFGGTNGEVTAIFVGTR